MLSYLERSSAGAETWSSPEGRGYPGASRTLRRSGVESPRAASAVASTAGAHSGAKDCVSQLHVRRTSAWGGLTALLNVTKLHV